MVRKRHLSIIYQEQWQGTCRCSTDIVQQQTMQLSHNQILSTILELYNYRMSIPTQKWTIWMLAHFTDLTTANSWLLYCHDNTECTQRKGIMQFLEFCTEVTQSIFDQVWHECWTYAEGECTSLARWQKTSGQSNTCRLSLHNCCYTFSRNDQDEKPQKSPLRFTTCKEFLCL